MSQVPGYAPPPRSGKPWWVWALGGCGGCLLLVIIAFVAAGTWFSSLVRGVKMTPVTPAAIEKSLAVPIYPGATLNVQATEVTERILGVSQRIAGKSLFAGIGAYTTPDSAEQVATFYKKKLTAAGWRQAQNQSSMGGSQQQIYQKGQEVVMVQEQPRHDGGAGTMFVVMRGGPDLAQHAPPVGGATPGAPGSQ